MVTTLRSRLQKDEEGFTLIELMVVVLIMAILMAIAIPTFLGSTNKAKDRSTQSDLRNALTTAKSLAADQGGLFVSTGTTVLTSTDLGTAEPGLSFNATASTTQIGVHVNATTNNEGKDITLVKQSKSGTKWYGISATSSGVVTYCSSTTAETSIDTNAECTGSSW